MEIIDRRAHAIFLFRGGFVFRVLVYFMYWIIHCILLLESISGLVAVSNIH